MAVSKNGCKSSSPEPGPPAPSHLTPPRSPFLPCSLEGGQLSQRLPQRTRTQAELRITLGGGGGGPVAAADLEMATLLPEKPSGFCYLLSKQVKPSRCREAHVDSPE